MLLRPTHPRVVTRAAITGRDSTARYGTRRRSGQGSAASSLPRQADLFRGAPNFAVGPIDEACEFAIDPALTFHYDPFSFFERPSHQVFALYKMTLKHLRETQGD